MPTFVVLSRHSPESCPMHNEKTAKIAADWMSKQEELNAKHGVKMVGSWHVHPEHLVFEVFEAPSYEAMDACLMEPEVMAMNTFCTNEVKVAMTFEEVNRMMQRRWQK
jgi:hypothetical protein